MKLNVGSIDRIIRVILGIVLGILYFMNVVTGTLGIILLIAGAILLLTGIVGYCGAYAIVGANTCKKKE